MCVQSIGYPQTKRMQVDLFDKAVSELSYEEAAMLAALPKAPSKYNPYKSKKIAKTRRDFVLKNLYENSYINKTEYEILKFQRNPSVSQRTPNVTPLYLRPCAKVLLPPLLFLHPL